jgi:hypothetical protein
MRIATAITFQPFLRFWSLYEVNVVGLGVVEFQPFLRFWYAKSWEASYI